MRLHTIIHRNTETRCIFLRISTKIIISINRIIIFISNFSVKKIFPTSLLSVTVFVATVGILYTNQVEAVGSKVTIPGLKKEAHYTWQVNEQDYLSLSGWTDCPSGHVITGGQTRRYNDRNKNLDAIECTQVDGLTGPIRISEFNHVVKSYAELFGPTGNGYHCSTTDPNCVIILGLKSKVEKCITMGVANWDAENQCDALTWEYNKPRPGLGQLSEGLYGCPENYAMVGVLKRGINPSYPDSPLDNNVTMVKCRAFSKPVSDQQIDPAPLADDAWGYCPNGWFARGLIMINHNKAYKPQSFFSWAKESVELLNNFIGVFSLDVSDIYDLIVYFTDAFSDAQSRELYNFTERGLLCNELPDITAHDPLGIRFALPQDGAVISTAPLTVSAAPSRDSQGRLPTVKIRNINNGYQSTAPCGAFGCVDSNVTLAPGKNRIRAEAAYRNGEVRSAEIDVIFDKFLAKINFVHPTRTTSYTTDKNKLDLVVLSLEGVSSPDVTSITWSRSTPSRLDIERGVGNTGLGYVLQNITLDQGLNIIDVSVRYKANSVSHTTNASLYVTRSPAPSGGTFGNPPPPPLFAPPPHITVGDRIEITASGYLNARSAPRNGVIGPVISGGRQISGSQGKVIAGPTRAKLNGVEHEWLHVDFDSGPTGWVAWLRIADGTIFLKKISALQPPPPPPYSCSGGTLCNYDPVTGTAGQVVCGTTLRNYQCTETGWKDLGTSCTCTLPMPPLQIPARVQAAGSCSGTRPRLTVSWGQVPTATEYEIHRKPNDTTTPYAEIARTTSASYIDQSVSKGVTYQYKVRARRASDNAVGKFQPDPHYGLGVAPTCGATQEENLEYYAQILGVLQDLLKNLEKQVR